MPTSTVVITMDLSCCRCRSKIEKILCKLEERCKFVFEKVVYEKDKVRITGPFDATDLICKLRCKAGCFVRNIVIELPPPPPPPKCCEKDPKCCKKEPKKKKCNDTPPTNIVVNVENPKQPDPTPCDTKVLFPFPYPFPCPYPYLQPACKLPWPCECPSCCKPPPPPPVCDPKPPPVCPPPPPCPPHPCPPPCPPCPPHPCPPKCRPPHPCPPWPPCQGHCRGGYLPDYCCEDNGGACTIM
ncbi:unnamed protein product [Urochloa humidicola]